MQRLFSTFPRGLPGAGLLLLRAAVVLPLLRAGLTIAAPAPAVVHLVTAAVAVLLLVGLWTPVVGSSVAAAAVGLAVAHPADPWTFVHLALVAGAIAMIGPGGFSIDARLFGRRQIEIPRR